MRRPSWDGLKALKARIGKRRAPSAVPSPEGRTGWKDRFRKGAPSGSAAPGAPAPAATLVMVEIGDRPTWWEVDAAGSRRLDAAPPISPKTVFRAAVYDHALALGRLTGAARQRTLTQDLGERGVAFRDGAITYCTPETQALCGMGRQTVPIGALLARHRMATDQPLPITMVIRLGDAAEGIACAWTIGIEGSPGGFATAVVFDEAGVREVGLESANAANVPDAGTPMVLDHAALYGLLTARRLPHYPIPNTWGGLPTAVWRFGALAAVTVLAVSTVVGALWATAGRHQAQIQWRGAQRAASALTREQTFDRHHLIGLARVASIAYRRDLRAARHLALPGALVTLHAGPKVTQVHGPEDRPHRVVLIVRARMHHIRGEQIGATGSWPSRALAALLSAQAPRGFVLQKILVNPHGTRYAARYIHHR